MHIVALVWQMTGDRHCRSVLRSVLRSTDATKASTTEPPAQSSTGNPVLREHCSGGGLASGSGRRPLQPHGDDSGAPPTRASSGTWSRPKQTLWRIRSEFAVDTAV